VTPPQAADGTCSSAETAGTLFVCATPIGNLADVTPRLRSTLAEVQVIACEDTRRTRSLLSALDIRVPRLLSHRSDNERASVGGVISVLQAGQDVALVSDAGTPAVSDPGARLVRAALDAGITVRSIAGPSAVASAVSVSGCCALGYRFVGFLPRTAGELHDLIRQHAHEVVVGFESPNRLTATISRVADIHPHRRVVVARELTKIHEQLLAGEADVIARQLERAPVRGEVVIILDALPHESAAITPRSLDLVQAMVEEGIRMKTACRLVAEHDAVSARALYERMIGDSSA
jgi:16S rRNA (cytidine1402-2'-O)-methyltransferase